MVGLDLSQHGEAAYEINVPASLGLAVWQAIMTAGEKYGITPYGTEAMHVLRAEKGFIIVGQETDGSINPVDLGMDWIVSKKKDFVGKEATLKARDEGVSQKLVTMPIDVEGIDVAHDEAILKDGEPVGYVSSGGYAHHVGKSMAMGYVATEFATPGTTLQVEILGNFHDAQVLSGPIYDANGANMRS